MFDATGKNHGTYSWEDKSRLAELLRLARGESREDFLLYVEDIMVEYARHVLVDDGATNDEFEANAFLREDLYTPHAPNRVCGLCGLPLEEDETHCPNCGITIADDVNED